MLTHLGRGKYNLDLFSLRQIPFYDFSLVVSIIHLNLILLKQTSPVCLVGFESLFEVGEVWEDLAHSHETWLDDKIYEADLALGNIGSLAIVKLTDRKLVLLLQITLLKEFHKNKVSPESAQLPRLGWV